MHLLAIFRCDVNEEIGEIMQKHAYIIAHNELELLETLVRLLDDPRNDIYIHIDAKVKNFDFAYFKQLVQKSKLEFTPRRLSVTWGPFFSSDDGVALIANSC